jgi:hypothetical protein
MKRITLPLVMSALGALPVHAAEGAWEQVSNKNGILVDRRAVEGSHLKEFRGRAVVDVPLPSLLAVFHDIEHATEWMDQCRASNLVEDRGDLVKIVYNRTRARWPVSDRDAVLRNDVYFDGSEGRVRIEFSTVQRSDTPPVKGVVRMPYLHGHWYLWPDAARGTRVEYQVFANPGGALPDWIVNYVSKELPRKTIVALQQQARRRAHPEVEARIRAIPQYRAFAQTVPGLASAETR